MRRAHFVIAAAAILAAAGCANDMGTDPAPAPAAAPSGVSPLAGIASGEYKTNQPGGCAYLTVSGEQPTLYHWDDGCDGGFDFTSRPPTLRADGDRVYVGRKDTSHYEKIRVAGDGFAATQEFRGRMFEVQFNPT